MESLPLDMINFIYQLRPLFRAEVFESFLYLMSGILIGEAKYGTVRASVFAPAQYQPQRLSDLFCRHKLSHQAFMAKLVEMALKQLYPQGLPQRLFWISDTTNTEKPYSEIVSSVGIFHRTKEVVGRAKHLRGHCYIFASHLYEAAGQEGKRWASVLVGALMYVKGRTIANLVGDLALRLRLPEGVRHCWIGDRGIISRPMLRAIDELGYFALGRVRRSQTVYFEPRRSSALKRRPKVFGPKCRVDKLISRFSERFRKQKMQLRVKGRERTVRVFDSQILLRGVWKGRPLPARVIIVVVPLLQLKPWYLITTDLLLEPLEAVRRYDGRFQIEVNFDEIKELGLGNYQGRSGQGVRRWPLFLSLAQMMLKFIATGVMPIELPELNWSWYERENTVGQVRRRLIELCRPPISRAKTDSATEKLFAKAA